jgi:Flp pilus assembly protein TadG
MELRDRLRQKRRRAMTRRPGATRPGTTTVELALVLSVFLLVLFGVFEYGRFIFLRQMTTQAAREGARYAVVNSQEATLDADTLAYVKAKMSGWDKKTSFYQCQIYMADEAGAKIGAAGDAQFGQYIAVQVDYDYAPVLPSFLFLGSTMRITSKALMYSEAN